MSLKFQSLRRWITNLSDSTTFPGAGNVVFALLKSDPALAERAPGDVWYNITDQKWRGWDGASVLEFGSGGGGGPGSSPTKDDKNLAPVATVGDGAPTGISITNTPSNDGYVSVILNGFGPYLLGDGAKVGVAFFFSNDGGTTARSIANIQSGDALFYNGSTVGFELDSNDCIDLDYNV